MKPIEKIIAQIGELTPDELDRLRYVKTQIEGLENSKVISEDNLRLIINLCSELDAFKELYFWRLIYALKHQHMSIV